MLTLKLKQRIMCVLRILPGNALLIGEVRVRLGILSINFRFNFKLKLKGRGPGHYQYRAGATTCL